MTPIIQYIMNTPLKSQFELAMEQFAEEGNVIIYSDKDSLSIIEDVNKGLEDFQYLQKNNVIASELELSGIVLNA